MKVITFTQNKTVLKTKNGNPRERNAQPKGEDDRHTPFDGWS
jgi:hypothetical protein